MAGFATYQDANKFLDGTTVAFTDASDAAPEQTSAEQLIRAYLTNRVPTATLATWDISTPSSVPMLIQEIAGRLMAAFRYRRLMSQNAPDVSPYAQRLYNEALSYLDGIISGRLSIPEVPPDQILDTDHLLNVMYYPNDSTTDPYPIMPNPDGTQNGYKFSMGAIF